MRMAQACSSGSNANVSAWDPETELCSAFTAPPLTQALDAARQPQTLYVTLPLS